MQLGIDPGPVDGIKGPRTRSAIKKYQLENGLPETGALDSETQEALGILNGDQTDDSKKSAPGPHHDTMQAAQMHPVDSPPPSIERSQSASTVAVDTIPVDTGDRGAHPKRSFQGESTPGAAPLDGDGEVERLRLSTIARLLVLSGLGLAALRPIGWVLLTGGSLMTVVLMINWIGGYFNAIAYGVFACAYITPVFFRLVLKSWDVALIFALFLGTPVLLISKYAFGLGWVTASCNGFAVLTLIPEGYRRLFSKRKYRPPYGTLYYRF